MKFTATREQILGPLQGVIGVVERKQTMPILANVLLARERSAIGITGTDLEVELVASGDVNVQQPGDITVPGRKLLEIFASLPEKATVTVTTDGEGERSGRPKPLRAVDACRRAEFPGGRSDQCPADADTLPQGDFRG